MRRNRTATTPPPEPPGSDATLHLLIGAGRTPTVSASTGLIAGTQTTWLRVEFDDRPSGRARHSGHFTVSGSPADVRTLVDQLGHALDHPNEMTPEGA
jgi:hypothetical protein